VHLVVDAKVTPLAGGNHVLGDMAGWVTGAEVGGGQSDEALSPSGGPVVAFFTPAGARVGLVKSTLAGALALLAGAGEADGVAEVAPTCAVACIVDRH
jgi:hypothetical protein